MAEQATDAHVAEISGDILWTHVEEFARRVKLSGTPEELESFGYLQRCMASYGYKVELIFHDAYISLPGKSQVVVGNTEITSITHSFSNPSPQGGLTAELVYIGTGTAQDFAANDVRGKIVLVDGIASPAVAERASEAGAAGQLHISPTDSPHEMCISPVWGSPSSETLAQLPTTVACSVNSAGGAPLRERLQRGETLRATLHAEVDTGWRKTPILVAELAPPGGDADTPYVLFTGHHDTWYYGVMDNGTANATMMETARILAGHRDSWRRGLRVCFWSGHSHGRYSGSAWYVDEFWDDLDRRCVTHVNVDSTGGVGANVLTASGVSSELAGLAREVILAASGQTHAGKRSARSGDESFWGVGIPAMFGSISHQAETPGKMRNALGWWWHTPHDTIDKIDRDNLVRDTGVFVRTVGRLLTDRVLPMDQTVQLQTMIAELEKIAGATGGISVDGLIQAAGALRDKVAAARRKAETGSDADAERVNRAMMKVSRALVPLDYTAGDRFVHDSALPHPAWPALQSLRVPADDHFAEMTARRTRNKVLHALRNASDALDAAMG